MDRQDIIDHLLDHYEQPRNYGSLEKADVTASGGHPECSDIVTIHLKINPTTDTVELMTFEGQGCTISQAAASILTEQMVGKGLNDIRQMDFDTVVEIMGREIARSRPRCASLALETLRTAVIKYQHEHHQQTVDTGQRSEE
ncbi:MAG: iron-sulfur cluster assembly scaffold protein [Chloroflexi bacterium AL-W]|nr:iron-sulfur cluster assembly scaffold protein [Chloroflexi bacterium AL-N1]NOK68887.1 iron-sulfur cluster assembly scaffold protein [Chloroflexi bacterium AL-N10]NOK76870.1 iron-sulfur cluster assembly scaffold protein [Chloroflexi bacterium AL-N5]NOK82742.1 iron-sulfur cluster assembly scaffold protein [Chloroflexi bacterium AL-W]NOK90727.1 iron-sulfur cluster assembly scaffold protein [Chloroflexi bacterium AL-N15]